MSERAGTSGTHHVPADDPLPATPSERGPRRRPAAAENVDVPAAQLRQAQKMAAIGELASGVAHELNNPLASIVAFSQLLRTDPTLPTDLQRQAELLGQEANRTQVIVSTFLDFVRERPPERVDVPLGPIVDSVVRLLSYVPGRGTVAVDVEIPADLPAVSVDRSAVQQVLLNLVLNAAQAIRSTGRPGRIAIRATTVAPDRGPRIRIEIADDGPGIPAAVVDRLFTPFVSTEPPGGRTGLGLFVSHAIVAAHGGTIRHDPSAAPGTTFVLELPIAESTDGRPGATDDRSAASASEARRRRGSSAARSADRDGRKPRILVLDDEPSIRAFLGRVLTRAGYTAVVASTGTAALEIIRAEPPDAILCDHRMAGMSGTAFHDAVAEIRPDLAHRFAFMSGDVLSADLRAFAIGRGVHLLPKPFDISTVVRTVETLLEPTS